MNKIYASKSPEIETREIEHQKLSREIATECMVLLENDGSLPIREVGKIALYGNGARRTVKGGTGSGDVNTRSNTNIEQGLENAGFIITTKDWLDAQDQRIEDAKAEYLAWANAKAQEEDKDIIGIVLNFPHKDPSPVLITQGDIDSSDADTAIYVIGRNSGEGADRFNEAGDYQLFPEEISNLKLLGEHYKNLIIVLNIGGVMDLFELKKSVRYNSILLMTQLGNIGGDALADVLTGKVTPSGKLTDTWAKSYEDYPSSAEFSHNGDIHDEYYTDGIYVGYRYFDSFDVEPEYPFGYGLSYTNFAIEYKETKVKGSDILVDVLVTNCGDTYAGKEVVQLYYSSPQGRLDKPYQELVAFQKTRLLAPGETEKLSLGFDVANLASYREEDAAWVLEAGEYTLRVGNSSGKTTPVTILTLEKEKKLWTGKNLFRLDCDLQEIKPERNPVVREADAISPDIRRVSMDDIEIETAKATYTRQRQPYQNRFGQILTMEDVRQGKCTVEDLTAQLTIEEMADLCVGSFRAVKGNIIGNASSAVPGAAGDTSSILKETRGIKNLILADGPAGLRLQPHFKTDKEGKLLPGGEMFGDAFSPFDPELNESNSDDYYQYCTAIPIGWGLAQSWNEELVEATGDLVGKEMEQFGVDLWLAPALNIHRNPLCGRNFEYYSEDPLVSGKIAAAITRGVQKHSGKGTTIKHFAVNNQEDNRYFVNAHVSERALREIYLKGFEIAVKESEPLSIMTSYNLLNGIHTANSYDLIQALARDEWGYQGFIMTDWFTSQEIPDLTDKFHPKYPISASSGCIYAGNDVQMPGCQKNVDDIIRAVKGDVEVDGYRITLADLQYCTANLIRIIAGIGEA